MGVPITFLDKYNPNQFTIVGYDYDVKEGNVPEVVKSGWTGKTDRFIIQLLFINFCEINIISTN
jgi:hypothetical protein